MECPGIEFDITTLLSSSRKTKFAGSEASLRTMSVCFILSPLVKAPTCRNGQPILFRGAKCEENIFCMQGRIHLGVLLTCSQANFTLVKERR